MAHLPTIAMLIFASVKLGQFFLKLERVGRSIY